MKNSIVFISNAFGGIKTFQDTLIRFIKKKKIECILIDGNSFKNHEKKEIVHYKINVLKKIPSTFKVLKDIRKKNKNKNTIFIFSNPIIFVIYFLYIKLLFDKKKIFFFAHSHLTKKSIKLYLCSFLSGIFLIFINKVFYVSKFTKKYWIKKYFFPYFAKNKIQYNSVDLSKKINSLNNKKFRIGFVGRLDGEKGLNQFLKIAYENKNDFIFSIFSKNKLRLNNSQKKYIKFYLDKNLPTIYKNIDLLLVTSPIENCPYSVLEAKSYGIPTLIYCTKGGINEIIKNNHNGIIISCNQKKLKTIDYINKIKFNYKFFSRNAYIDAKKYDANVKIPQLIESEIISKKT